MANYFQKQDLEPVVADGTKLQGGSEEGNLLHLLEHSTTLNR